MRDSRLTKSVRAGVVALLCLWSLGPLLIGVSTSLSTPLETKETPTRWIPREPDFSAYEALLGGAGEESGVGNDAAADASVFPEAMKNSIVVTLVSTAAVLLVAVLAGYGFSRLRFAGSAALLAVVLAAMVVPLFTLVVALFRLLAELDLVNTMPGLVMVYITATAPLAIWLFFNYCRELPPDPEEAALIDGCSRFGAFVRVVLPQMRSGIAALTAITMLGVWGQFLIPLLLTSTQETKPVTVVITEFIGKYTTNYPLLTAAGILAVIPPAIVALALNRHIRGMLSAGG